MEWWVEPVGVQGAWCYGLGFSLHPPGQGPHSHHCPKGGFSASPAYGAWREGQTAGRGLGGQLAKVAQCQNWRQFLCEASGGWGGRGRAGLHPLPH